MQQLFTLIVLMLSMSVRAEDSGSGSGDSSAGLLAKISAAIDSVVAYVKGVFDLVTKAFAWLSKMFVASIDAIYDLLADALTWLVEGVLKLAAEAIKGIADGFNFKELTDTFSNLWGQIPVDVMQVMQAIGVPSALGIVVLGILIRIGLQLIPFVRLGS